MFAELDTERRERLAELVAGAEQVLVTAAVPDDVPAVARRRPHRRRRRQGAARCRLTDPDRQPPDEHRRAATARRAEPDTHDDTGLDLARSIARVAGQARAPKRTTPTRRRNGSGPTRRRVDPQASGAHPDERDPQLLDTTIGRLIAEQGWGTDVRVHGVFSRWDTIVGREVAQHCTARGVRRRQAPWCAPTRPPGRPR